MATYRNIIEGLQLLATLQPSGLDAYGCDAEHDILYAGPDVSEVPDEIAAKLEELGWHLSDADRFAIFA